MVITKNFELESKHFLVAGILVRIYTTLPALTGFCIKVRQKFLYHAKFITGHTIKKFNKAIHINWSLNFLTVLAKNPFFHTLHITGILQHFRRNVGGN